MADLKTLSDEMAKLKKQIEMVISIASYHDYDDLSGLDDYQKIKSSDDRQKLEEYRQILYKLNEVQNSLAYFERPVREISKIYLNESGRYETNKGHYYTSGSSIEFLRNEEVYNYETNTWEEVEVWTTSCIESRDGQYYIVGYDVELPGLTVRVR